MSPHVVNQLVINIHLPILGPNVEINQIPMHLQAADADSLTVLRISEHCINRLDLRFRGGCAVELNDKEIAGFQIAANSQGQDIADDGRVGQVGHVGLLFYGHGVR